MIYVVAELRLKPGMAEKAAAEARKVVAGTVKEDGCLGYDFHLQRERSDAAGRGRALGLARGARRAHAHAASRGLARSRKRIRRRP